MKINEIIPCKQFGLLFFFSFRKIKQFEMFSDENVPVKQPQGQV